MPQDAPAPAVPCWLKTLQVTHELFLSKTCPVFVGMVLVAAIAVTCAILIFGHDDDTALANDFNDRRHRRNGEVWCSLLVFSILVFSSVGLKMSYMKVRGEHSRAGTARSKTYMGGLAMMPAWGWKDVVVLFTLVVLGEDHEVWQVCCLVLGVALASACFQIVLEYVGKNVSDSSFLGQTIATTRACFAVGCGFAVNLFFMAVMTSLGGDIWNWWPTRLFYTLSVTALHIYAQREIDTYLEEHKATMRDLSVKTITFLESSGKFVVAWAWKGFLDLIIASALKGVTSSACHDQIVISAVETLIFIVAIGLATWQDCAGDLTLLVCGMCMGWAWAQVWVKCYYGQGFRRQGLGVLWVAAVLIVTCACMLALLIDWVFKKTEDMVVDELKEDEPLFGHDGPATGAPSSKKA